jgi:hypothetical protein
MSDEYLVPEANNSFEKEAALSPGMLAAAGDALSKSLLFALCRDYLDAPIFEQDFVRFIETLPPQQQEIAFFEVQQVGKPVTGDSSEYLDAIRTTLAACHDPRYALVFIISSDGLRNHIYMGVSARTHGTQPSLFANQLGQFLCSNWPGTKIKPIEKYRQIIDNVHTPLCDYRYARAFTGIPSLKIGDASKRYPHSLDRFMRGLRGKPYIYMVIAEPLAEANVRDIIAACHTLSGQVQAFTKATIQSSTSTGTSESVSRSESETSSTSETTGTSESSIEGVSKGVLGTAMDRSSGLSRGLKGIGLGALSALLVAAGGPFLLSGMLGMFGQLLPSTSSSRSISGSTSHGESFGKSTSESWSEGATTGESMSFGREYLNRHAEACRMMLEQTIARFEAARAQGCWNVGVYLISNHGEAITQAQAQLKALVSGERSSYEPIRIHDLGLVWDGQVQTSLDAFQQPPLRLFVPGEGEQIHHPIGEAFEGLSTPLNTDELSLLANLPLREMPGMPMQPTAFFSLNPPSPENPRSAISIGRLLEGGEEVGDLEYQIDLNNLTRHVFITGITGSGKSNTCRQILETLMKRRVNFIVIEPVKDEYVQLALAYNESGAFDSQIAVYMPGRKSWGGYDLDQLQLNPFDVIRLPGAMVQVMPHLDRLKSIFNASFPMYEVLPVILEEALVDLYDSQGWLKSKLPPDEVGLPTLSQLFNRISGLVEAKGYEERITNNITAALETRIGNLMRGWKGELFDHSTSTSWEELFGRPVVINLQQMGDDADKCLTMALLLNFLYEYRQAQYECQGSQVFRELRHLAIFEEAHRVLRASSQGWREANPQAKMGEMFADILAEIRAYGQGLAIIDQVPSKLIPDALKNTNMKIVHRLVSSDDRDAMASALALTDEQSKVIPRLKVGQAIVSGIQDDMASWVKVNHTPLPTINAKK